MPSRCAFFIKLPKADACQSSDDDPKYDDPQKQTDNAADNHTFEEKYRVILNFFSYGVMDLFKNLNRVGCLHFVVSLLFFVK
jgi:hypothetical protein